MTQITCPRCGFVRTRAEPCPLCSVRIDEAARASFAAAALEGLLIGTPDDELDAIAEQHAARVPVALARSAWLYSDAMFEEYKRRCTPFSRLVAPANANASGARRPPPEEPPQDSPPKGPRAPR